MYTYLHNAIKPAASHKATTILLILFGGVMLCWVAFQNNFPLVFSDTGDYIESAFGHFLPIDRPVFYGLFIRLVSLQSSLWLVILVQGIMTSYVIYETLGIFFSAQKRYTFFIANIFLFTAFTGLSHNVSILLPDIFCPISVLCFVNLLFHKGMGWVRRFIISAMLLLSLLVAYANVMSLIALLILLLALLFAMKLFMKKPIRLLKKRIVYCAVLIASFFIIAPTCNYLFGKKFIISEGSHVFMMNHLLETGILEDYLNSECGKKNYILCQYKDKMDTAFIWSGNSPLYKMGGWDATKDEFNRIIRDIITTPRYDLLLLQRYAEYTAIQFFTFDIPIAHTWGNDPPLPQIKKYYPVYGRDYCASLQYSSRLNFNTASEIQRVLVFLSLAIIVLILVIPAWRESLSPDLKWFTAIIVLFTSINAFVCANFATLNSRYEDRVIWLIPFTAFLIVAEIYQKVRSGRQGSVPSESR